MSAERPHIDVGIVVRDLETCLAFYRDVLGLPLLRELDHGKAGLWEFGLGECRLRLIVQDPVPEHSNPPGGFFGATGMRYWSMEVEEIDALVGRCTAAGATVSLPVRDGSTPGVRIAMVEDPEGNTVEFIDRTGAP